MSDESEKEIVKIFQKYAYGELNDWNTRRAKTDKTFTPILKSLSLERKLDKRVVNEIAFHPLLFFKRKAEARGQTGLPPMIQINE